LFTAKVVSQSIYNIKNLQQESMVCSPQMFNRYLFMVCSPPKLIAAKVYTTWFVHRSSLSHDATVARSLHGGLPSFSPFLIINSAAYVMIKFQC
jgi:hypothetical protein